MSEPNPSIFITRQGQMTRLLEQAGLDALALNAGNSQTYFTGLRYYLMERPIVALLVPGQPLVLILPGFESGKAAGCGYPLQTFTYGENPSLWPEAFASALGSLGKPLRRVGVEGGNMRFLELSYLQAASPGTTFESADRLLAEMRLRKDENELAAIQKAVEIAEQALLALVPRIRAGRTEAELASELTLELLKAGSETSGSFEPIVAGGPNSANPHAVPTGRPLQTGDLLIIDWGAIYRGYISDLTRTLAIGEIDPELKRIAGIVKAANQAGCQAARPGIQAGEVDRAARRVIAEGGYGDYFLTRTGHGIGMDVHEEPYLFSENTQTLAPGMTFTVEPGIYLAGRGGVRIEDNVVVTAGGARVLSRLDRDLIQVKA